MEFILNRVAKKKGYTIGKLYLVTSGENRLQYICDTLEPTYRNYAKGARKIMGKSAIPDGRYPLAVVKSKSFGRWLPKLINVPMFKNVEIHPGNSAKDTKGCILPGNNIKPGFVYNSRLNLSKIMEILDRRYPGEPTFITVR